MQAIYEAAGHYLSLTTNPWRGRTYTKVEIIRWLLKRMARYGLALAA